jgi:hypothetical protein
LQAGVASAVAKALARDIVRKPYDTGRPGGIRVTETFDAEPENEAEAQRQGWQAIMDNFRRYVEAKGTA